MWAVLAAIVGFIGGVALATLSARLQRRNWQIQEAMRVYCRAFVAFDRLWPLYQKYIANPDDSERQDLWRRINEGDGRLNRLLKQCWMLERRQELRQEIDKFTLQVQALYCSAAFFTATERDSETTLQEKKNFDAAIPKLKNELDDLRKKVAQHYFHSRSTEGESTGASQGPGPAR